MFEKWKITFSLATLLLLAQSEEGSTSTIDLSAVTALLTSILPIVIVIAVIGLVFKLISNLTEGLSKVYAVAYPCKTKHARKRHRFLEAFVKLVPIATFIAQTENETISMADTIGVINSVLVSILPIVMVVVVIGVVMKLISNLTKNLT